jgi:hypothetical protein
MKNEAEFIHKNMNNIISPICAAYYNLKALGDID